MSCVSFMDVPELPFPLPFSLCDYNVICHWLDFSSYSKSYKTTFIAQCSLYAYVFIDSFIVQILWRDQRFHFPSLLCKLFICYSSLFHFFFFIYTRNLWIISLVSVSFLMWSPFPITIYASKKLFSYLFNHENIYNRWFHWVGRRGGGSDDNGVVRTRRRRWRRGESGKWWRVNH